ncbi:Sulfate transport system permease protein CysT [compost metagenome]
MLLPNCKPAILTAFVLTFAHTVGEFGVVLMIGGNIPGVTKVASVAVYNEVEALNYPAANEYAMVLFAVTFIILLLVYSINNRLLRVRQPA